MIIDIKKEINEEIAKKIFSNKEYAIKYLKKLGDKLNEDILKNSEKNIKENIWKLVVDKWSYDNSKKIIRELFKETEKYKIGKEAKESLEKLYKECVELKLGEIKWPCSQGDFDGFVQRINNLSESGLEKDDKVKSASVKYRRLKEINTYRNDYLEFLIFNKNDDIIPTLNHVKGIDFFIDGIPYDQKVARSPTKNFIKDKGENWRKIAIENPLLVAEYLYKYQDEGRFSADPRLYIVYLDEDISVNDVISKINEVDLENPLKITFKYKHKDFGEKEYTTKCFVILLYKKNEKNL